MKFHLETGLSSAEFWAPDGYENEVALHGTCATETMQKRPVHSPQGSALHRSHLQAALGVPPEQDKGTQTERSPSAVSHSLRVQVWRVLIKAPDKRPHD